MSRVTAARESASEVSPSADDSEPAARHGIKVSLCGSPYGGTVAIVLMPHHLVVAEGDTASPAGPHATGAEPGSAPEKRSAEEVRALISSIQQGWRTGRAAADRADGDVPGPDHGANHGPDHDEAAP
jgi:hypothetical protein